MTGYTARILACTGVISLLSAGPAWAAAPGYTIISPDGKLKATVTAQAGGEASAPTLRLSVSREGVTLLEPSPLGLTLEGDGGDLVHSLTMAGNPNIFQGVDETFPAVCGKRSTCVNRANGLALKFSNAAGKQVEVVVRAYDDGAAWRYRLAGEGQYRVASEASAFCLPEGFTAWAQKYTNNGESEYVKRTPAELDKGDWGNPLLVELPGGKGWALLTQSDLDGRYAGLQFRGAGTGKGQLNWVFPPDQKGPITGPLPLETPWRVVIAGPTLGTIVESDLVKNLGAPSKLADTSWIKPGRVAWSWWSDGRSPRSLDIQKQYVDFAQEMGWEYVLVDAGWNAQWVPELVQYARDRKVDIILWRNARGFNEGVARQWSEWGVKGAKLDFIDSDNQAAYRTVYDVCLAATAKYKLPVNFHGASKPAGEQRTWPHNLTREGVKGGEARSMKSAECINYIYTRNVPGSMDYTPVQLSRLPSTVGNQLAQSVLFESGWQHFVDTPERYRAFPGKELLKVVPVTWDDTKFIDGRPDTFACLARRKGNDWYVGIAATAPQTYKLALTFLKAGTTYSATLYKDGATPTELAVETKTVTVADTLEIPLLKDGGCTIRFQAVGMR